MAAETPTPHHPSAPSLPLPFRHPQPHASPMNERTFASYARRACLQDRETAIARHAWQSALQAAVSAIACEKSRHPACFHILFHRLEKAVWRLRDAPAPAVSPHPGPLTKRSFDPSPSQTHREAQAL